ncbi:hypothetical protein SDC9_195459 [bioreactor metagenome]|uniref:Uncharacterized protein n=1 Tax=bioreactor metagenome TaxID=1076179 RepID=A0A645I935_9ZZZZ
MEPINWKRKLSSRKFWALLAALVTASLTGIATDSQIAHIIAIITSIGACVAYMFAEAKVDAASKDAWEETDIE